MFTGSHDSFTSRLQKSGNLGPDVSEDMRDLNKCLKPLMPVVVRKWAKTQTLNFAEQLVAGIRYFDLRISPKPGKPDIYVLHALFSGRLEIWLEEISLFLKENTYEVVILDINHVYSMDNQQHERCVDMMLSNFGDKICPLTDISTVTLHNCQNNGWQVIVLYHDKIAHKKDSLWPATKIISPWPNTTSSSRMIDILEKQYTQRLPMDRFHVTQGILTPDLKYIGKHIFQSLKSTCASRASRAFVDWVAKKNAGSGKINICIVDFVEKFNYIDIIIELNYLKPDTVDAEHEVER